MRQLARDGAIMDWLLAQRILPGDDQAKAVAERFSVPSLSGYWAPICDQTGAAVWAEALAELKRAADHPLPSR